MKRRANLPQCATVRLGVRLVYDVILLTGSSKESWDKAAANAVKQASKSLRNLRVAEMSNSICNWTRRERWKPIARRSGYRSKSSC